MSDVFIFVVFFFSEVMKCCVRIYIYIHIIHLLQFTDGMFEFFRKDEPFLWNIKFMVSGGSLDCDKLTTAVKWKKEGCEHRGRMWPIPAVTIREG